MPTVVELPKAAATPTLARTQDRWWFARPPRTSLAHEKMDIFSPQLSAPKGGDAHRQALARPGVEDPHLQGAPDDGDPFKNVEIDVEVRRLD